MVRPVANWRTITGIRKTSSSDTVNLIVEAYHQITDGEVGRVDFYISSNGGAASITSVTSRADWSPDDTDTTDPLPGNTNGPAVIPGCFGLTLPMSSYSAGYIDVYAIVYPGGTVGTPRTLETIRVYNDKDGNDRRPSTKTIYVSPTLGSNSNDGLSSTTPVQTIIAAIIKCQQGGVSNRNVGGATIYLMEGTHTWARIAGTGLDMTQSYTEGHYWLTITNAPGVQRNQVIVQRDSNPANSPTFAGVSANQSARLKLKNITIVGINLDMFISSNILYGAFWVDGCEVKDSVDYPTGVIAVGTAERTGGAGIIALNMQGVYSPVMERFCTGSTIHHYKGPFSGFKLVRGCNISDIIGVCFQVGTPNESYCNCVVSSLSQNNTKGYIPSTSNLDILSTSTAGRFRIRAKNTSVADFGDHGRYLLEISSRWGLKLAGWPGNNNGNFTVVGAGYENGLSYIDITNSNGSQQTTTPTGTIEAVQLGSGLPFTTVIHSDLHQVNFGANADNWMLTNIRSTNAIQAQGISNNGSPNGTFAIVNLFDGKINNSSPNNSYLNGPWTYGIIRNCTFAGNFLLDTGPTAVSGEILDCIFENISISNFNYSNPPIFFANIHFSNSVSSTIFSSLPNNNNSQGTWKSEYDVGLKGNARVIQGSSAANSSSTNPNWAANSQFYSYDKGVLRNVALGDWRSSTVQQEHGKCMTLNDTVFARSDVVTLGVPFPKGKLTSTGQEIVAYGDGSGQRRVQWEPLPTRWEDGSIKYAKVSFPITLTAGQALETNLRIGGPYSSSSYSPVLSKTLNNINIDLLFNGTINTLNLNNSELIEGGGPQDHLSRYRLFGRIPTHPHIWYELIYDVFSNLQHSKFWLRYGNSYAERGYGLNQGPHANSALFSFGTNFVVRITGATPFLELETRAPNNTNGPICVNGVTTLTNGKQYTVSTVNSRDEYFGIGIVKCLKGTLVFNAGSYSSASAELNWPTTSAYRNWKGLQPIINNSNNLPSYLATESQRITSLRAATIPSQYSSLETQRPYQISVFGNKSSGATGTYGWRGLTNWANSIYYAFEFGYPADLVYLNFASYACLGFRPYNMREADGTYISLRNYPLMGMYDGNIDYRSNVSQDNAGYGLTNPVNSRLPDSWQGNNHQHFQNDSEILLSLISCDYHLLELAKGMAGWCSIMSNPNHFNNVIKALTTPAREVARPLLTHSAIYEASNDNESLDNLIGRVRAHYTAMYETTTSSPIWSAAGNPLTGLDYVMFTTIGYEAGESSLPNNRTSVTYAWQFPFVVNAFYRIWLILKNKFGPLNADALKARKIAYDLAASNVLYHQHKVGYGSENNWQYISCDMSQAVPNDILVNNNANYQSIAPGSTVVGLTSGATGTIIRTIGEIWDGHYADFLVGSCVGQFVLNETVRVTSGSTQHTLPIRVINSGYIGCKAYHINSNAPASTRQTPLTLSQLEEVELNPTSTFADKVYPGKYYRTYWPYQLWQQTCATIAKQGIAEGYYTDGNSKTVAYLQEKVEDIIATSISDAETYPVSYNGNYIVDTAAWPYLMLVDNVAVNQNTSRSITANIAAPFSLNATHPQATTNGTVVISKTITVGSPLAGVISTPIPLVTSTTINNVSISAGVFSSLLTVRNPFRVTPITITNVSVSISSPLTLVSSYEEGEIIIVNIPPTIINIFLEMLINTPVITEPTNYIADYPNSLATDET